MSPFSHGVDAHRLVRWCEEQLGSPPAGEIFRSGHLSAVFGFRLADGRAVVVKLRPNSPRVAACVEVQRRLFERGYPCPEPLTGATPLDDAVATAETYVPGGAMLPAAGDPAGHFAGALAQLISLAPSPGEVPDLHPPPPWADWNQTGDILWPHPADDDVDLNDVVGPAWIDEAASRARDRLRAGRAKAVIGHCDWLAANLRWDGDKLLVVHDWDSITADSEAVLAGFAAALYSTLSAKKLATVEETERFLEAYRGGDGRQLSADELELSWAAGTWTLAYDARYQHALGRPVSSLTDSGARERLRRAGT